MKHLESFLARMAALLLFLMMVVVLVDVIGRGLLNSPLSVGTELTEILMMGMVFMVLPLLAYRQRDITVDILSMAPRPWMQKLQVALSGRDDLAKRDGFRPAGQGGDELEGGGVAFDEGAGVDEVGGGEAQAAQFAHGEAHGQIRVSGEWRQEKIG